MKERILAASIILAMLIQTVGATVPGVPGITKNVLAQEVVNEEGIDEEASSSDDTVVDVSTEEVLTEDASSEETTTEETTEENVVEGECGENVTWYYDVETKTLTISGEGAMTDYTSDSDVPWNNWNSEIAAVIVQEGVTHIGTFACSGMTELLTVNVETGVLSIGYRAFYGCSKLQTVLLPNSVESIGYRAFAACTALSTINIPISWKICTPQKSNMGEIFYLCRSLTSVEFPEGMTRIPDYALDSADYVETVVLPETITEIGEEAFNGCSKLSSINIPSNITSIGRGVFQYCSSLKNVVLPEKLVEIGARAFKGVGIQSVTIPDTVERIGYQAFGSTALTEVTMPRNWNECTTDKDGQTPGIGNCGAIFEGCNSLERIVIQDGITNLPDYALSYCTVKTIQLPNTLTSVSNYMFAECGSLTEISLPETVTDIGAYAFYNCYKLSTFTMPSKVTEIKEATFARCSGLTEFEVPEGVETIGYQAFYNCKNLTSISLPSTWKYCSEQGAYLGDSTTRSVSSSGSIFKDCSSLSTIELPEGMTTVPDYAFSNGSYINTVKIPSTVTEIGEYAFYNCVDMYAIDIPDGVQEIKTGTFQKSGLRFAAIPGAVESVGDSAYEDCSKLVSASIPLSVTNVGRNAFDGVSSQFTGATYQGTEEDWANVTVATGNYVLTDKEKVYGVLCDYEVPTSIVATSYTKPEEVTIDTFYGSVVYHDADDFYPIDLQEAFFGPMSDRYLVAIPKDSYITFGFDKALKCQKNSAISITTIGNNNERVDIYVITLDGDTEFIGHLYEDGGSMEPAPQRRTIPLGEIDEYIVGIKLVGRDNGGATPGYDVINLALIASETDAEIPSNSRTRVTLQRGEDAIDILEQQQVIEPESEETVSILVEPDWQDAEPGKVVVMQENVAVLENAGGAFVDITPAALFKEYRNIYVVLFDANGEVVEKRLLKLSIGKPLSDRTDTELEEIHYRVMGVKVDENGMEYEVTCPGAKVVCGEKEYTVGSGGYIKMPLADEDVVTISYDGYYTKTVSGKQIKQNNTVYLYPASKNGEPVITAVWLGDTDVLRQSVVVKADTTEESVFKVEVEWGDSEESYISLKQKTTSIRFNDNQVSLVLSKQFYVTETFYVEARNTDGQTTTKELKIRGTSDTLESLDDINFSLGDTFNTQLESSDFPEILDKLPVGLTLGDKIPLTVSLDGRKLRVAVGVDLCSVSGSGTSKEDLEIEVKDFVQKFKEQSGNWLNGSASIGGLAREFGAKPTAGKFGFDASISIMGYVEATIDKDGNISDRNGSVYIGPKVSFDKDIPFTFSGIPLYLEAAFAADLKAILDIVVEEDTNNNKMTLQPDGVFKGDIEAKVGVGVGHKDIIGLSGGVNGKLSPVWDINYLDFDTFKIYATLGGYISGTVLGYDLEIFKWTPIEDKLILDLPKSSGGVIELSETGTTALYDASQYEVQDLSYIESGRQFLANNSVENDSVAYDVFEMQSNIYRQSKVQYVALEENKKLAVWLDSSENATSSIVLYYSYYDGSNWSVPQEVDADGTMDSSPILQKIGGTVYLAWENVNEVLEDQQSMTLNEVAATLDIAVATFSQESGFVKTEFANDGLDMTPTLGGDGNHVYLAWVRNQENNYFGNTNTNSIVLTTLENGTWTEPITQYEGLNAINGLALDYKEEVKLAYSVDVDGDYTTKDMRVYENGEPKSFSLNPCYAPVYLNHSLFWSDSNSVVHGGMTTQQEAIRAKQYQMILVNNKKAVVYTESEGLCSSLKMAYFNDLTGQWEAPIVLISALGNVVSFQATVSDTGEITILYNQQETDATNMESPYGESTLRLMTVNTISDIAITNLYCDKSSLVEEKDSYVDVTVENLGTNHAKDVTVQLKNIEDNVLSTYVLEDELAPGASIVVQIPITFTSTLIDETVVVYAEIPEISESNLGNNQKQIVLSYENLSVIDVEYEKMQVNQYTIFSEVANYGLHVRNEIVVELRKGSEDGEIVDTVTIEELAVLHSELVSFEVSDTDEASYYVVVRAEQDDFMADNMDYVVLPIDEKVEEEESTEDTSTAESSTSEITDQEDPTTAEVSTSTPTPDEDTANPPVDDGIVTPPHEHTIVVDALVAATFDQDGSTEGSHCSTCGEVIVVSQVIPRIQSVTLNKLSYTYNGKKQTPKVTVKDSQGTRLVSNTDYVVAYAKGRKNVGVYSVTVTFKGKYAGVKEQTFTILPKATSLTKITAKKKGFTAKWKKQSKQVTGYELQYSINKKFTKKTTKTVKIGKYKTITKTISKLNAKKKYYVRIRTYKTVKVKGKNTKLYSKWSKVKTVKTKK